LRGERNEANYYTCVGLTKKGGLEGGHTNYYCYGIPYKKQIPTEVVVSGIVKENVINSSSGQPMFLKIVEAAGTPEEKEFVVLYHENNTACANAMHIKEGDKVEAKGVSKGKNNEISVCGSENYYIKMLDTPTKIKI
jgi:hypothetical protein